MKAHVEFNLSVEKDRVELTNLSIDSEISESELAELGKQASSARAWCGKDLCSVMNSFVTIGARVANIVRNIKR